MSSYTDKDRVIALAGVFQAARLARDIARNGICDAAAFEASRESLFTFEPGSVAEVFGGVAGVAHGLRALLNQVEDGGQRDAEIARYAVSLLHLADRARANAEALRGLGEDLTALARRRTHFELTSAVQHEQFAQIYQDRISVLGPRIMVRGEPLHLQNPDNAARVRVALLAGIRAAVLWRQARGSKWQLVLRRGRLAKLARELVDEAEG
jgi:high frequency lysogenization protein